MVVIWERGKEFCGVLHVDSDVYAALIPKVQIVTCFGREMETDVLHTGIQGRTRKWWKRFKRYPGVWLLFGQQAEEDLCSAAFLQHVHVQEKKKKILIISVICIIKRNSIRKFSLSWEMTWVCWNYSQMHKRADGVQQCLAWFVQTVWWNLKGQCWDIELFIHWSNKETDGKNALL